MLAMLAAIACCISGLEAADLDMTAMRRGITGASGAHAFSLVAVMGNGRVCCRCMPHQIECGAESYTCATAWHDACALRTDLYPIWLKACNVEPRW